MVEKCEYWTAPEDDWYLGRCRLREEACSKAQAEYPGLCVDHERARADKAEAELADYRLLMHSDVPGLRLMMQVSGIHQTGLESVLERVVENILSAPAPAQEEAE